MDGWMGWNKGKSFERGYDEQVLGYSDLRYP